MSAPDRRQLVDRTGGVLSICRQCELLGIARSGLYRSPSAANDDLAPHLLHDYYKKALVLLHYRSLL